MGSKKKWWPNEEVSFQTDFASQVNYCTSQTMKPYPFDGLKPPRSFGRAPVARLNGAFEPFTVVCFSK